MDWATAAKKPTSVILKIRHNCEQTPDSSPRHDYVKEANRFCIRWKTVEKTKTLVSTVQAMRNRILERCIRSFLTISYGIFIGLRLS